MILCIKKTPVSEPQQEQILTVQEWPNDGTISFSDVIMRYPVLRRVNFDIQTKEKVVIVGRTGAGKSSLAVALFRLVELSGGIIYVDGEDISKLHLNTLRSKISTITQEPVLFAGTIRYNVDPFSKYSDVGIWEALEKVHKKEKILLLDETTANIDTTTYSLIQETLRDASLTTVITIAHRLNTVLHCDKIIVLDSGQVMECGYPQDLISNPHSFLNSMIHAQSFKTPSP